MSQPTLKYYKVTSNGTSHANDPAYFNATGGPAGTEVGTGVASPNDVIDFGNDQAGSWVTPIILMMEFTDNTASSIRFSAYDIVSNLEDFSEPTAWQFKCNLTATYTAPSAISQTTMAGWSALPMGSAEGLLLDTAKPLTGLDGTSGLLVARNGNVGTLLSPVTGDRFYLNFWLYLTFKPEAAAVAGAHTGWGYRTTFVYPGF